MTHSFDDDAAIDVLAEEAGFLIEAVEATESSAQIPFCPGWSVADLAIHTAGVFRWVNAVVSQGRTEPPTGDERRDLFADPDPSDATGVIKRLRQATDDIVSSLAAAPADLSCWTIWTPPGSAREFWVRRLVFETLVHRVDAENARSQRPASGAHLDSTLSADGVDELVCGFARRYASTLRCEKSRTLSVRATDAARSWWIEIGPDEPFFGRGDHPAPTAEVRGAAGELLLLLWNRRSADGLEVLGDASVLTVWREGAHL